MDLQTIFKRLGYPKHTDKVYTLLSKNKEPQQVTDIAEQCSMSRVVVYRCLEALLENKLVIMSELGKRKRYALGSPHILKEILQLTQEANTQVAETYITKREKDVPQSIRFLHGAKGIRAVFDEVISHTRKGDTFFRYTSERDVEKVNAYLSKNYRLKRDQKKLERLVISNPASGAQKKSRLERFIKFIPAESDQFAQNIIQLIYGERVAIIDLNKEEVVVIENKQLAEFQKVIFKLLYKRL